MDTFDLYKFRYNLSNYLIMDDESFITSEENFNYWNAIFIVILIIINFVILINYKELGLISIFFIICCILFVYYCNKITIFLDNIKSNELILNYSKYFKLVNAIFIESFNNLPNSNKYIYNYINNLTVTKEINEKNATIFTPVITDITDNIVRKVLSHKSFTDYFNNFLNIFIQIIYNIKFNDNITNDDLQIFIEKNMKDNDILKYANINENNSSFNLNKNLFFYKIDENNTKYINIDENYKNIKNKIIKLKNNSYTVNEIIIEISNGNLEEYVPDITNVEIEKNTANTNLMNAKEVLKQAELALETGYNVDNTNDYNKKRQLLNIYNSVREFKNKLITIKEEKINEYNDIDNEHRSCLNTINRKRTELIEAEGEYKILHDTYDQEEPRAEIVGQTQIDKDIKINDAKNKKDKILNDLNEAITNEITLNAKKVLLSNLNIKIKDAYEICEDTEIKTLKNYNFYLNINNSIKYLDDIKANITKSKKELDDYNLTILNINLKNNEISKLNKLTKKYNDYREDEKNSYLLIPIAINDANNANIDANVVLDNLFEKITDINLSKKIIDNINIINESNISIDLNDANVLNRLIKNINDAKNIVIELTYIYNNKLYLFKEAQDNKNKAEIDKNTKKDISKYYLINLEILDKCIIENTIVDIDVFKFFNNIYNDILKIFNNKYKIKLIDFKILYQDTNILNNNNFKIKINEVLKEFNFYIYKILLISIYFLTVVLHAFYTKILNSSHYISFLIYLLLFIVFIIIFYSSIYSKLL